MKTVEDLESNLLHQGKQVALRLQYTIKVKFTYNYTHKDTITLQHI